MTINDFAILVNGKVWKKRELTRIYFDTDRTATAYLDYDEDLGDGFVKGTEGAVLKVFSNCHNQGTQWNINRAKQIKHNLMQRIATVTGDEICENWQDVIL